MTETDCNCEKKCFHRIPKSTRKSIYETYIQLTSNERSIYLYGLIHKTEDSSTKTSLFSYHVRVDGYLINVCQKAFMNIHGLGASTIQTLTKKLNMGMIYPGDLRRKNRKQKKKENNSKPQIKMQIGKLEETEDYSNQLTKKRKITQKKEDNNLKQLLKEHIYSLLLDEEVIKHIKQGNKPNVSKMWHNYKIQCETVIETYIPTDLNEERNPDFAQAKPVSKSTYNKVFIETYPQFLEEVQRGDHTNLTVYKPVTRQKPLPPSASILKKSSDTKKLTRRGPVNKKTKVISINSGSPKKTTSSNVTKENVPEKNENQTTKLNDTISELPTPIALAQVRMTPIEVVYFI